MTKKVRKATKEALVILAKLDKNIPSADIKKHQSIEAITKIIKAAIAIIADLELQNSIAAKFKKPA